MVQCDRSLVKSQYSNGRARFPSIERHTPSTISKLSRGKWLVSHRHHSTGTPQTQVTAAICEKLPRTLARRAARTITSMVRCHHPNVWSNSSSRIGSASTPALCNNRSCPASALRFAVWSNSSPGIASNTPSGAASCCQVNDDLKRRAVELVRWFIETQNCYTLRLGFTFTRRNTFWIHIQVSCRIKFFATFRMEPS